MNLRKKALFSALFFTLLFLLASCGKTVPAKQAISHPTPVPPSLFVLSSQGNMDAYCVDGKQLWQANADTNSDNTLSLNGTHILHTDRAIYIATDTVRAYSYTGQIDWQHDLPSRADDMLLVGQTLYVACAGSILAWNVTSGALQWQQSNVVLQATTVLTADAQTLFVAGQIGSQVTALNLQSGAQVWSQEGDPGEIIKTLSIEGNTLLVQTDGSLTAVQKTTGKILWHRESQIQTLFIDSAVGIIYTIYIDVNASSPITSGLRALSLNIGTQLWNVSFPIHDGEKGSISSTGIVWTSQTAITAWDLNGKQRWQISYAGQAISAITSIDVRQFSDKNSPFSQIIAL